MNKPNASALPLFIDPAIGRKAELVHDSLVLIDGMPMPSVVEISESGTCNRVCSFCPRSDPGYIDRKEFIEVKLLLKLVSELSVLDFRGLFVFSGFVEPMLDKNIYKHISLVRKYLPYSEIEMVTNGDVLSVERLSLLFASGLSTLLISVYDGPEAAYNFKQMINDAGLGDNQVIIRHRYLPESQNFGITLNNRAGMMSNANFPINAPSTPLTTNCNYPHYTFFMDYQGDVLLCPHDWGKKRIAGNLNKNSFFEIWSGDIFSLYRTKLSCGDRTLEPCKKCDVHGTLIGNEHVHAWKSYHNPKHSK